MKIKIGKYPNHRFYHNWLYTWFGYSPKQRTSIKIHKYDTWSMDHTLAPIILPMLVQLKATTHGAPRVDNADVPKELRTTKKQLDAYSKSNETDPKHFERWDWIMDEMIWAFEQKTIDWETQYYGEWVENKSELLGGHFIGADYDGLKAHQERMNTGFCLFGKYYENLWD